MPVRRVEPLDGPALRALFAAIPPQDAAFLKEDVTDAAVVNAWLTDARGARLVHADDEGVLTAVASVSPGAGRSDHVAELRLVVDARRRRSGIGRELAQQAVLAAIRSGCRKIMVEVGATQEGTVHLFQDLGFVPEALHRDQVRADDGRLLDVVVLAHSVDDNVGSLSAVGELRT